MLMTKDDRSHPLAEDFIHWVRDDGFPCVGAKAAVNRGGMRLMVARSLTSAWDDLRIMASLLKLASDYRDDPALFQSLVVIFEEGAPMASANGHFVHVFVERDTNKPAPIPNGIRQALEKIVR